MKVFRLDVTPEQARALADELGRAADAGLFHPSIVEPVAAGIEGTVAYRAEEYVAAESLDVALRHYAPAPVDKVLPFITQLASALDFARAAGVGHGALHPRDIFVTPDEARATGFGVVDALDRLGLRAPVRRPYSPPERIAGQPWATPADVFSLAAIAFELFTGRRPSGLGQDMGPLSGATLGERTDEIRTVLARAMHVDPSARFATAQAFSAALAEAAGVSETTVSLVTRSVSGQDTRPVEPELRIVPAAGVDIVADLSLAAPVSVAQPPRDVTDVISQDTAATRAASSETSPLDDDQALDDFAAEPEVPSPNDSPREVARKMIAAREVRKRQVRKKPEKSADDTPAETAQLAGLELGSDSETSSEDSPGAALFDGASRQSPEKLPLQAVDAMAKESTDSSALEPATPTTPGNEDDATEVPALETAGLVPAARDLSDRVVAVDEFRPREVAKADRWPRGPERIGPDRSDRPERAVTRKVGALESIDAEIPPPSFDEAPDRQRLMMLPLALVLSLGLVLGYAAGYVVGNRERPASVSPGTSNTPATPAESETPGTTGRGTPKETTEQVVPGAIPPVAPSHTAAPSAAPATVKPTPPAPTPREVPRPTAGRIVVTSRPAKAAVTVNGKWSGRTPLTIDAVKFGKYVVRVVEPGYEVARDQFTLSAGSATRTVDVNLRREPAPKREPAPQAQVKPAVASPKPSAAATGDIYVDSRPRGARVFVDGKELGVTPLRLTGQSIGSHVVRLELADHQSWTATARVVAEDTARITGSLDRIR